MPTNFMRERPDENRISCDSGDLPWNDISPHIREQIPGYVVRTDRVVPVGLEGDVLVVAMEDPGDAAVRERIRFITGRALRITVASSSALDRAIRVHYAFEDEG
jgi:hypothetical protein